MSDAPPAHRRIWPPVLFSYAGGYWIVCVRLWFGQLNIKREGEGVMFSERYKIVPTCVIGPVRFTWRGWTETSRKRREERMRLLGVRSNA